MALLAIAGYLACVQRMTVCRLITLCHWLRVSTRPAGLRVMPKHSPVLRMRFWVPIVMPCLKRHGLFWLQICLSKQTRKHANYLRLPLKKWNAWLHPWKSRRSLPLISIHCSGRFVICRGVKPGRHMARLSSGTGRVLAPV